MTFGNLKTYLTWKELLRRTYKDSLEDDALGLAAQMAYYFFLALVPALLFLLALASFFPIAQFTDQLTAALARFAAPELVELFREQLLQISMRDNAGLLSLGLIGAIWSSSAAVVAVITALNHAYDIEEARPWWKVRLIAIALTVGLALFVLTSFTLVLAGPSIAEVLTRTLGLGVAFTWIWNILQWPLAFALICLAIGLVYYAGPDADQEWVWVTPGALLATTLWLIGSLLFRWYVVSFGDYQATYGALGAIVVLLLWMYLTALVIVLGAEINAEIEHASPWGKDPGEKHPGERKKLGSLAARAFRGREAAARSPVPSPAPESDPGRPPMPAHRSPDGRSRVGDWALAFMLHLVWPRVRRRVPRG